MNKVIETIKERSSTRGYMVEPLTKEELEEPAAPDYRSAPQLLL